MEHQCVVLKGPEWYPEEDDKDFETYGKHFLTGISSCIEYYVMGSEYEPVRHGVKELELAPFEVSGGISLKEHRRIHIVIKANIKPKDRLS